MEDEAWREEILRLSLDWRYLRDCAELSEAHGYNASDVRVEMAELREKITDLEGKRG